MNRTFIVSAAEATDTENKTLQSANKGDRIFPSQLGEWVKARLSIRLEVDTRLYSDKPNSLHHRGPERILVVVLPHPPNQPTSLTAGDFALVLRVTRFVEPPPG